MDWSREVVLYLRNLDYYNAFHAPRLVRRGDVLELSFSTEKSAIPISGSFCWMAVVTGRHGVRAVEILGIEHPER